MKEEIKLAIAFYANTEMQIALIESLEGTTMYCHQFKQLLTRTLKECEKRINHLFKGGMSDEMAIQFNKTVDMSEVLIKAIKKGDIDIMINLLREYSDGNISIVENGDHKKFLKGLEKI